MPILSGSRASSKWPKNVFISSRYSSSNARGMEAVLLRKEVGGWVMKELSTVIDT